MPGYYLDSYDLAVVKRFVDLNLAPLLDYWYEGIGVGEMCEGLRDLEGECIMSKKNAHGIA